MKSLVLKSMFVLSTSLFVPSISMAQDSDLQKLAVKQKSGFELRIDKNMTDADLKKDETDAKKYDFEVEYLS